jgi:hypothetical protein
MSSVFVMDIPSVSVNDNPIEFDDSDAAQQRRADIVRKAKRDIRNKAFLLKHPDIATAFDLVKNNEVSKEKPVEKPKPKIKVEEESVKVPEPVVPAEPVPVIPKPPVEPVAVATAVRAQPVPKPVIPKPEPEPVATATAVAVAAQPVKVSTPAIKNVSNPITIRASMDGKFF